MLKQSNTFFVIGHNIRSLLNVGSIFRTADAFGVTKLYLTGYTGRPDNIVHKNKISKSALGAEEYVPWEYNRSAVRVISKLRKECPGIVVIGLENNTKVKKPIALPGFTPTFPLVLILGEEVAGIQKPLLNLCDDLVEIPMQGKKESLNVSVAFGVAAYEIQRTACPPSV